MTKIQNQSQYEWAVKRVEELLFNLVADYSEEHFSLGESSFVDVLKFRMFEMGLNQKSLAKLIGVSPSYFSDYIFGKCEPTLKVTKEISWKLNIDANYSIGSIRE